ncbi:MAG: cation transporter, partial [Treponemataceae bacterium]|nr:cation transporter [Treponemataceae bacterium]
QPLLDPIIALCVGCWVVKNSVELFRQINLELMDGNVDNSLYKKLFEAAAKVSGVTNPHRARIRKMASFFDIDLDIEVDPSLTVFDAHELSEQVEENVRAAIPEVYDIVIHVEPAGSDNHQRKEKFGLRAQDN